MRWAWTELVSAHAHRMLASILILFPLEKLHGIIKDNISLEREWSRKEEAWRRKE